MPTRYFWCGILIVALTVSFAVPARADDAETVLIVVAATALAATIAVIATVAIVHHRHHKIVITGCVATGNDGMTVIDEEDRKTYTLSGNTAAIKPGERVKLQGKKLKARGSDRRLIWDTREMIQDFGTCQP